ncbi:MAG: CRISPR-associated endonuclease Cas2 [bacterium]|nr:CRISPR-associated endonuclease Cas2 [bacterium]
MARGSVIGKKNLTKDTLLQLAILGGVITIAATSPYFLHQVAKIYFKEKAKEAMRNRARKLRELEHRKLISFKQLPDHSVRIEFSQKGKTLVRHYNLEDMRLQRPPKWDGTWRLVMYDIPTQHNQARDAFRKKLRQMGLYQLQKSVWISPFDCRKELEFLSEVFELDFDKYICYLTVPSLPREQELRKFFDLS